MEYLEVTVNIETGETSTREMTIEEIAELKARKSTEPPSP